MLYINRQIGKYLNRTNDLIKKENINLKNQLKSCNDKKQSTAGKKAGKSSDKYLVDESETPVHDPETLGNGLIF